jgi:hypothetical protein
MYSDWSECEGAGCNGETEGGRFWEGDEMLGIDGRRAEEDVSEGVLLDRRCAERGG